MSQPALNRLVFAGEAIVDLLMWVPALPERGGDMLAETAAIEVGGGFNICLLYTSPSPRDRQKSRMPSSA